MVSVFIWPVHAVAGVGSMLIYKRESVCEKEVKSSSSSPVKMCPTVIAQQFENR